MIYKTYDDMIKDVPYEKTKEGRKFYREEIRKINKRFKSALEKHYGIENNPKRDKLWEIAWEDGHAGGYSEIEIHYDNMVELIR